MKKSKPMYLYGKNSVYERLKIYPKTIKKIYLQKNFNAGHITRLIKSENIAFEYVSEKVLYRIKYADRLQGIVAEADRFEYVSFDELLYNSKEKILSFIFLDSVNDPHNLGSIMRTAACFGDFAIVIPDYNACEVNETVLHVASGGENFVPVARVSNFAGALIKAKRDNFWIVGATVNEGQNLQSVKLPFPICLVLGSEGKGLRHGVEKLIELKVNLPMFGARLSFNVAMACSILCYEISRQRNKGV